MKKKEINPDDIFDDHRPIFQNFVSAKFDQNPEITKSEKEIIITDFFRKCEIESSLQLFMVFKNKLDETWKYRRSYRKKAIKQMLLASTSVPSIVLLKEDDKEMNEKMWSNLSRGEEIQELCEQIKGSLIWTEQYEAYVKSCVKDWIEEEKQLWTNEEEKYVENLRKRRTNARTKQTRVTKQ